MKPPEPAEPKGKSLADELIADDPLPDDARRFDPDGMPLADAEVEVDPEN